jgi:predicted RND superfamily exporter protein
MLPRRSGVREGRSLDVEWLGRLVENHAVTIVTVGAATTVLLGLAATRLHVDTSIGRLQAQTGGAVLEREITERFSLPDDVLLVLNENQDVEPLLEADEDLRHAISVAMPSLSASGIGVLLPSAREQARVAALIESSGASPAEIPRIIESAAQRAGFRPDTFRDFVGRVPRVLDPSARISYHGLLTAGLQPVISHYLVRGDGMYRSVTYLFPKPGIDIDAVRSLVRAVDPHLRLTGLPVINHDLRRQFFLEFVKGIGIGAAAVAVLIFTVFRTVRDTLLAFLPTVIGLTWSAGLLALLHVDLDLFSLFAAVTFIGIAVDYGIYPLYRYRLEPEETMRGVMTKTGAAIAIACATALVGFGTLVDSAYRPLHVFGIVSLVTLSCCLVASILFLPALVVVIDGARGAGPASGPLLR